MKINILDKTNTLLVVMETENWKIEFAGELSDPVGNIIQTAQADGIIINRHGVTAKIVQSDRAFPLALADVIRSRGYRIQLHDPETAKRLKNLLETMPDELEKQGILGRVDSMSLLEASYLVEELSGQGV